MARRLVGRRHDTQRGRELRVFILCCAGRIRTSDLVQAMSSVAFFSQDPGGRCAIDRVES